MRSGSYNTKSKQLIVEYLENNRESTVTAEDIAKYLESVGESVNITTVYRHLDRLTAEQKLMRYAKGGGKGASYRYVEADSECHDHLHLQCTRCGKILHMNCEYMNEIIEHISHEHAFDLKCGTSILYGMCSECREKMNAEIEKDV